MSLVINSNLNRASVVFRTINPCIANFSSLLNDAKLSIICNSNLPNSNVFLIGNNASTKEIFLANANKKYIDATNYNIDLYSPINIKGNIYANELGSISNIWNNIYLSGNELGIGKAILHYEQEQYYQNNDLSFLDKNGDYLSIVANSLKLLHIDNYSLTFSTDEYGAHIKYFNDEDNLLSDINITNLSTSVIKQGSNLYFSESNVLKIANSFGLSTIDTNYSIDISNYLLKYIYNTSNELWVHLDILDTWSINADIASNQLIYDIIQYDSNASNYISNFIVSITDENIIVFNDLTTIITNSETNVSNYMSNLSMDISKTSIDKILTEYSNNQVLYLNYNCNIAYNETNLLSTNISINTIQKITSNHLEDSEIFLLLNNIIGVSNYIDNIHNDINSNIIIVKNTIDYDKVLNDRLSSNLIEENTRFITSNIDHTSNQIIKHLFSKHVSIDYNDLITCNLYINNNILPFSDTVYDLGSATHRWKDLYLSGNTIHLNDTKISVNQASNALIIENESGKISKVKVHGLKLGNKEVNKSTIQQKITDIINNEQYTTDQLLADDSNVFFIRDNVGFIAEASNLYAKFLADVMHNEILSYLDIDKIQNGTSNKVYDSNYNNNLIINGNLIASNLVVQGHNGSFSANQLYAKDLNIITKNYDATSLIIINAGKCNIAEFSNNNLQLVTIDYQGKIGIGSTIPKSKIDVNGDIKFTGNINNILNSELNNLGDTACNIQKQIDDTYPVFYDYMNNVSNLLIPIVPNKVIISSNTITSNLTVIDASHSNIIANTSNFIIIHMNPKIYDKTIEILDLIKNTTTAETTRQYPPISLDSVNDGNPITINVDSVLLTYGNGNYIISSSIGIFTTDFYATNPKHLFNYEDTANYWISRPYSRAYNYSTGAYILNTLTTYTNIVTNTINNYKGEWVQIQLPDAIILPSYELSGPVNESIRKSMPKDFILVASNDGSSWFLLDDHTNLTWSVGVAKIFTITNNNAYSYYRIVINKTNADGIENYNDRGVYELDYATLVKWKLYTVGVITEVTGKEIISSNIVARTLISYVQIDDDFSNLLQGKINDYATSIPNYNENISNILTNDIITAIDNVNQTLDNIIETSWTNIEESSDLYFTGKVGIKNILPISELDVNGDIIVNGLINNLDSAKISYLSGVFEPIQSQINTYYDTNASNSVFTSNQISNYITQIYDNINSNITQFNKNTSNYALENSNTLTNSIIDYSFVDKYKLSPWFDIQNNIYNLRSVGIGTSYTSDVNKLEIYNGDLQVDNGTINSVTIGNGFTDMNPIIWYKFDANPYLTSNYSPLYDNNTNYATKFNLFVDSVISNTGSGTDLYAWYRFNQIQSTNNETYAHLNDLLIDYSGNNRRLSNPSDKITDNRWPSFNNDIFSFKDAFSSVLFNYGSYQYLNMQTFNFGDSFTLTFAFWIEITYSGPENFHYRVFNIANNSSYVRLEIDYDTIDAKLIFILKNYNVAEINKSIYFVEFLKSNQSIGSFLHIVWTISSDNTWKIYINGSNKSKNGVSYNVNNSRIIGSIRFDKNYFAYNDTDGVYPYYGSIDDFRIYTRELTHNEVKTLYTYNYSTWLTRTIGYNLNNYNYTYGYLWQDNIAYKYSNINNVKNLLNSFHTNGFSIHFIFKLYNQLASVKILNIVEDLVSIYINADGEFFFKVSNTFVSAFIKPDVFYIVDLTCTIFNGQITLKMYLNGIPYISQSNAYNNSLYNVTGSFVLRQNSDFAVSFLLQDFRIYDFPLVSKQIMHLQVGATSYGSTGTITDTYQLERWQDSTSSVRYITYNAGYVGIKTISPQTLLHVGSSTYSSTGTFKFFNNTNTNIQTTTSIGNICAYFDSSIIVKNKIISSSDVRIKTNISDINDDSALQKIMSIEPKTYNYIVPVRKHKVYGFIAQQIREVIPEAVTIQKYIIPDIFTVASCTQNVLSLSGVSFDNIYPYITKLSIIDLNGIQNLYTVTNVDNELHTISVDKNIDGNKVFIYGREVDDFHALDKSYIFTLNVCATQKLAEKIDRLLKRISYIEHISNS
jgi:hypothetical protein